MTSEVFVNINFANWVTENVKDTVPPGASPKFALTLPERVDADVFWATLNWTASVVAEVTLIQGTLDVADVREPQAVVTLPENAPAPPPSSKVWLEEFSDPEHFVGSCANTPGAASRHNNDTTRSGLNITDP